MGTATTPLQPGVYSPQEKRHRIFAIMAASSGNLVEWFDFYVYAFSALYFAGAFFPKADPTVQLLITAGVFAAGFLMRPIGGWIFGRIADKYGRKLSLLISVAMMCTGSLVIAKVATELSLFMGSYVVQRTAVFGPHRGSPGRASVNVAETTLTPSTQ